MSRCKYCGQEWGPPTAFDSVCSTCWKSMAEASRQATKNSKATRPKVGVCVSILAVLAAVFVGIATIWLMAVLLYAPGDPLGGENGPVVLFAGLLAGYAIYRRIRYRSCW